MIVRLPIDLKSLFYNILNDNLAGHTATVATVIKQGNSLNEKLNKIFAIDRKIDIQAKPDLIKECIKNSKTSTKVVEFFVFDKISVNGVLINPDCSYGIFVKQEIDETKVQFGRIKMHYPNTLKYIDNELNINNGQVIKAISNYLNNFAFLVNAFDYNTDTEILNFDITILGANNIPYSKVFVNEKGVGNKMVTSFIDEVDAYDMEIVALRNKLDANISPTNYIDIMIYNKNKAIEIVVEDIISLDAQFVKVKSNDFPYLPYDIEYVEDNEKKYIIVMQTATDTEYFNLSINKIMFISSFIGFVKIALVTNITDKPIINYYTIEDLRNFSKNINSIEYKKG
ncbi:MAG TPA: hypothetical protein PKV66_01070 [Candidatus Pelethenecus sp.]|nr:hypothetical protein [Candidatus Pelethenecus sp.]